MIRMAGIEQVDNTSCACRFHFTETVFIVSIYHSMQKPCLCDSLIFCGKLLLNQQTHHIYSTASLSTLHII